MSDLLAGLINGYNQSRDRQLERTSAEEMKKLQVKMFKAQLEDQEQRMSARNQLIDMLSQNPELAGSIGGQMGMGLPEQPAQPQQAPPDMSSILRSPQGQSLMLQMGGDPAQVASMGKPSLTDMMAQMVMGQLQGQSGAGIGGLELSGVKLDPSGRPMLDFSKPESAKLRERSAAERDAEKGKKADKAVEMLGNIYEAEDLLDKASGGLIETAVAKGKGVANISDESTQANEQLKLISGWLVANVPRMEGPQSEFDVKNYQQMAGKVGDSTVPVGDRKAALKQLIKLQQKYAGINGASRAAKPKDDDPLGLRK